MKVRRSVYHLINLRKKDAVSPVIATILMVTITVVLATVLYVMVMGFGEDTTSPPATQITKNGTRYVISIERSTDYSELQFKVVTTVDGKAISFSSDAIAYDTSSGSETGSTASATFVDAGADNQINCMDYFTTTGSGTIFVLWVNGDSLENIASIDFEV